MPILDPLEPGDVPYPQYSVVTTQETQNTPFSLVKGRIYTMNPGGFIFNVSTTFEKGIFQCMSSFEADADPPRKKGQFLGPRTRMVLIADETLHVGEDVFSVVDTDRVQSSVITPLLYLGKVFAIYTRDADGNKKMSALSGEKVIVETVGP